jgi:predicted Zn-dependent peptidase
MARAVVLLQELARVKKSSRASLLSGMTSNSSMAATLAAYHATTGSWRGILEELQVGVGLGEGMGFGPE